MKSSFLINLHDVLNDKCMKNTLFADSEIDSSLNDICNKIVANKDNNKWVLSKDFYNDVFKLILAIKKLAALENDESIFMKKANALYEKKIEDISTEDSAGVELYKRLILMGVDDIIMEFYNK